ncbi:MAG: hypothetical protein ACI4RA_05105 [Kiritimatiellia bacterium]
MRLIAIALLLPALLWAEPSRAPMEWEPVQTNEIARWKAENHAPEGVVADAAARRVRFLAEATGVNAGETIEFLAIGPLSDRAYESLLVTVASPAAIASAFDKAGIPRGIPADPFRARLWPYGEKVVITARAWGKGEAAPGGLPLLVRDAREKEEGKVLDAPVVWTGGARDARGEPVAATNTPCAVFALYNHVPSLLQLDGLFDQSSSYGRFVAATARKMGDLVEVTATWDGRPHVKEVGLTLSATNAAQQIAALRESAQGLDLHVRVAFDSSVTVERAATLAQAFALLDGDTLKMNGQAEGQFYFRAFLPEPTWRERAGRIFQPFEVHVAADGARSFVFCEEDWSGEGVDPVLKPKTTPFKEWGELPGLIAKTGEQGAKVFVLFVFAPKSLPVTELTPIIPAVGARINTFYVFGD